MPSRPPPFQAAVEFGLRVRRIRAGLGYSQERLAEIAGVHWTYLGSVERGQRNIALGNILKIAAALEVDPAELVTELRPE